MLYWVSSDSNAMETNQPEIVEAEAPSVVEERCWVYVARLNPTTSTEKLSLWLKSKLCFDDILCFPLIPRGVATENLRMISFKIGVPKSLLIKVKDRNNWPSGILIRDFVTRAVSIPTIETDLAPSL